jgi:hypothetical protein
MASASMVILGTARDPEIFAVFAMVRHNSMLRFTVFLFVNNQRKHLGSVFNEPFL